MEKINKIKISDTKEMYETTCDKCGKQIIAFGEHQLMQNMKMHKLSCGDKKHE